MKLLRDTIGTTGRYLDLMRINAPLRIQGPLYRWVDFGSSLKLLHLGPSAYMPRQFHRYDGHTPRFSGHNPSNRHVHNLELRQHDGGDPATHRPLVSTCFGSLVPYRHTYNASRII
eukprot:scaffold88558_cov90-Phaeocystis_antarctica.AAC.1